MKNKTKILISLVFVLAVIISGCTPGPKPKPAPILALGGGSEVSVAKFNGKYIYTMVSAQPSGKPESNSGPTALFPYTLTTTAATSSIGQSFNLHSDTNSPEGAIFSSKQTFHDLKMRREENEVLASRAAQLSKGESGVNPAAPTSISVGTAWNDVWVLGGSWVQIDTTCRYISSHAYFFVDNRDTSAMSTYLAGYGTAFDSIYLKNHSKFGIENDTDGNGKVIIIFSRELTGGLLGYFYSIDKYPKATYAKSNEGDIFYLTTDTPYQGNVIKGTLAHEFQHMIYFDEHYDRGVTSTYSWLNEALSQAAEFYNNYLDNHHAWISYYLNNHWMGLSLTHWTSANYGYGALFARYLIDQYGDTAIKNMCATNKVGVNAVESATGANFNTIFNNFTRALVLSGTGDTSSSLYNFKTLNLQTVQPSGRGGLLTTSTNDAGDSVSGSLYPYRIFFANWTGSFGTMNLSGGSMVGTAFGTSR